MITKFSPLKLIMRTLNIFCLLILCIFTYGNDSEEDYELYYYGIEESERGLAECASRQACATITSRYWRPRALVRLCRCARRRACSAPTLPTHRVPLNNRAYLQFCEPVYDWPQCGLGETALTVHTPHARIDPDELEDKHHASINLTPPNITLNCRCPSPNYWKLKSRIDDSTAHYKCGFMPQCRTGEFCGNVDNKLFALYQSCLCPKHHICVHNGGVTYVDMAELLYLGKGWRAYCQKTSGDNDDDEYDY